MKILLLGSNGQLGSCLVDELSNTNHNLVTTNRLQIDVSNLKLTEREIDILLLLNENKKPQNVNALQSKVWGYSSELETHTVETHIYRLRKKIKEKFIDDNFIKSHKDGYSIK